MKSIRIPVLPLVLMLLAAAVAAVVTQMPEIERYLKVKAM
jgi:hypothetical protein